MDIDTREERNYTQHLTLTLTSHLITKEIMPGMKTNTITRMM